MADINWGKIAKGAAIATAAVAAVVVAASLLPAEAGKTAAETVSGYVGTAVEKAAAATSAVGGFIQSAATTVSELAFGHAADATREASSGIGGMIVKGVEKLAGFVTETVAQGNTELTAKYAGMALTKNAAIALGGAALAGGVAAAGMQMAGSKIDSLQAQSGFSR